MCIWKSCLELNIILDKILTELLVPWWKHETKAIHVNTCKWIHDNGANNNNQTNVLYTCTYISLFMNHNFPT